LGNGSTTNSATPVTVSVLIGALAISGGAVHSCALLTNGGARCWGDNAFGQLGNGTTTDSSTPVAVSGLSTAVAISAGGAHSCALMANGTVRCWGDNGSGQLGNDSTTDSSTPVNVHLGENAAAVAIASGGSLSCALIANGTMMCWGDNSLAPVSGGLSAVVAMGVGGFGFGHRCAIVAGGGARCAGANTEGQLGDGSTYPYSSGWVAAGQGRLIGAVAIAAGGYHSCGVRVTGVAMCWGDNTFGQLGNGTTTDASTPVTVRSLADALAISASNEHSCALLTNGTAKCWGRNADGRLGNGTTTDSSTPVVVSGLVNATAIAAAASYFRASSHVCALLANGFVKCWGDNGFGQLGNGTTTDSSTPVIVSGI
jgi:alpha-tubulin suppressor-like RCC1 family protein